jgi:hypothetical protein
MSAKLKHQNQENGGGGNVTAIGSAKCSCENCNKKSDLQNFCTEHFEWFKWGLVTKEGKRPTDFDKKFQAFTKHKKVA